MPLPQSDTRCSAGVAGSGHPIKAPVCSLSHLFNTFALLLSRVLSRDLASTLSTLAGEPRRSDGEDTLEEQTAVLLQLPRKLEDVCEQLCEKLQKVPLPALGHVAAPVGSLSPVLCSTPPTLVPSHGSDIVLKLITSNEPPPVNIRVVIGKAAATSATYRPQPSTSPLYDFCELQILMLGNLDRVQLRDVDLRCPDSPLAKRLRQRFYEMLHCNVKLGKRTLSEFRADESSSTYYLHVLVSSDGQRLTLRAKLLYDPVYLHVPVVEDGKVCPWNKPAFAEICEAIEHASV
ncbi:unnamed protein product [Cladocopium goreaui]|uniref:Uncharacterized protein n=1 Tax=Cladocopium goreaui TaxID=2562237 RepID=A0A9P1GBN6_9DINO|nr:unnamed protein product [Cladocopium goreaui]